MSSSVVEQIKERLDIVDVIGGYIKVEKAGINYKAKCPFHNEKTASFFISSSRQSFYCFGCGEKGDIFSFVEKFEGLDFKGALKTLADRAGVELKKGIENESQEEREKAFKILEEATLIFEENLKSNKKIQDYLKKRGLTEESIKKWRIGFAEDEWRDLYDKLLSKNFTVEELSASGLIKKVEKEDQAKGVKYYDTFRDRVIFPISDSAGRVIAFSGRTMKKEDGVPKYINSPETKLFYKSETLYGLNVAKEFIRKLNYAVLVEGQMDLVMSHQAGVWNTVASSGTALTELHLKRIGKLTQRVIIAYDSDKAGENAARKAAQLALSLGMEVKVTILKEGDDPAEIVKRDAEEWREALKNSIHFIDFALNKALEEKNERKSTKEVLQKVLPSLALIRSDIEKSQFIRKIAFRLKVDEASVKNDLEKVKVENTEEEISDGGQAVRQSGKTMERLLVGLIFIDEDKGIENKEIIGRWEKLIGKENVAEILSNYKDEKEALIFEAEIHIKTGENQNTLSEIMKRMEGKDLKEKLKELALTLDDKDISEAERKKAQKEFQDIQIKIKELGG